MKKTKRLWALLLAMVMALGLISTAFAAPTIDSGRKASLSLYKYDITAASEDGAWNTASYVSTGVQDDAVTDKLAQYAIQGVEFSYLRVASISAYSQRVSGQYKVGVLYGFADDAVFQAIGLTKADAYKSGNGVFYFTSDKLNKALADALADNATTVKNALEIAGRNGVSAMHPIGEGGILAALWDMAEGAGIGLSVEMKKMTVRQETIEVCEVFHLNPYQLTSTGAVLMVTPKGEELKERLKREGIPAEIIGHTTEGNERIIWGGGEKRFLDRPAPDELARIYEMKENVNA